MRTELARVHHVVAMPVRAHSAVEAHASGVVDGLRRLGHDVATYWMSGSTPLRGRSRAAWNISTQLRTDLRPGDVVYLRQHPFAAFAAEVARRHDATTLLEVSGHLDDILAAWPRSSWVRPALQRALARQVRIADTLLPVTEGLGHWANGLARTTKPTVVVPNGVAATVATRKVPPTENFVSYVGSLAPWQGIEACLDAVREPTWPAGVRLVVVGSGPRSGAVARASSTSDMIDYLGQLPHDEALEVMARGACTLIAKDYEPRAIGLSPIKLYEAMALGVPIVATNIPGLGDVVERENAGVVVPSASSALIADAVARVIRQRATWAASRDRLRTSCLGSHTWDVRARLVSAATLVHRAG